MQLCKGPRRDDHTEVCFEDGTNCPVCEFREKLEEAVRTIADLEEQLQNVS